MAYLDVLNTVHTPVSTDGNLLKNASGVVIATCTDPWIAAALAELVNLGTGPAAEQRFRHYEEEERAAIALFNSRPKE